MIEPAHIILKISLLTKVDDTLYYEYLEDMPSLEKIALDVPSYFVENEIISVSRRSNVEEITINAMEDSRFDSLLRMLSLLASDAKILKINGFCGIWDECMYEYDLNLSTYYLESLKIDVTPAKRKTEAEIQAKITSSTTTDHFFFVLEVYTVQSSNLYTYKVPINLTAVRKLDKSDFQRDYIQGKDYLTVKVHVGDLKDHFIGISYKRPAWGDGSKYLQYKYIPF